MKGKDYWKEEWVNRAGRIPLERFRLGVAGPAWQELTEETERLSDGLAAAIGYENFRLLQSRCADETPMTPEEQQAFLWFLNERAKVVASATEKSGRLTRWLQQEESKIKDELLARLDVMLNMHLSGARYWPDEGPFGAVSCRIDGRQQKNVPLESETDRHIACKDAFAMAAKYFADRIWAKAQKEENQVDYKHNRIR